MMMLRYWTYIIMYFYTHILFKEFGFWRVVPIRAARPIGGATAKTGART